MIAIIIVAASLGLLVYVLALYPGLVLLLGSTRRRSDQPRWVEPPRVSMIFSAHNEAGSIAQKLENSLSLNYPEDKLDVVVVDDGSSDGTCAVVRDFQSPRITLLAQEQRSGKTAALNRAAQTARGAVLVFTDANAIYERNAIRHLIEGFDADGQVAVVCGELRYQPHPQANSDEESRYWNLEIRLKKAESNLGTLLGANGSIYAQRRELFQPLREDLISDFIGPLLLAKQGYRTVYQPQAVSLETSTRSLASEFRRKKRIVQRSLYGLWAHRELLSPFSSGWLAVQLWSHKVLRWLLPLWLFGLGMGCFWLRHQPLFLVLLIIQLLFYAAGLLGLWLQVAGSRPSLLRFPAYIMMLLGASLAGLWGFIQGQKVVTWEPQR